METNRREPFLKIGSVWESFNFSGCLPVVRQMLYILLKGTQIMKLIILRSFVGMPLGPVPLFLSSPLIRRNTSLGVHGSKKNELGLGLPNYFSLICCRQQY